MANKRVRDMAAASTLSGTELFYADDGSNDVKVTAAQISAYTKNGLYYDIRDFGVADDAFGTWTTALQATIDFIGADGHFKTILIPSMDNLPAGADGYVGFGAITIPDPTADVNGDGTPGWTFLFANNRIWFDEPWTLPSNTTIRGMYGGNQNVTIGQFPNGTYIAGPASPKFFMPADAVTDPLGTGAAAFGSDNVLIENVSLDGGSGWQIYSCGCECTLRQIKATGSGSKPPVVLDAVFWGKIQDCIFSNSTGYSLHIGADTDLGQASGLIQVDNVLLTGGGILIDALYGPQSGNMQFNQVLLEDGFSGAIIEIDSSGGVPIQGIYMEQVGNSDDVGTVYTLKNTGSKTAGIYIRESSVSIDPSSDLIGELFIQSNIGSGGANIGTVQINPPYSQDYGWTHGEVLSSRLVNAPRTLQSVIGDATTVGFGTFYQDTSTWTGQATNATVTTGKIGPDGTANAAKVDFTGAGEIEFYDESWSTAGLAAGDWLIFGGWVRQDYSSSLTYADSIDQFSALTVAFSYPGGSWEVNGAIVGNESIVHSGDGVVLDGGWHWFCRGFKITTVDAGHNLRIRFVLKGNNNTFYCFNPCGQIIWATLGLDDQSVIDIIRSYRGGWSQGYFDGTAATMGDVSLLDHQGVRTKRLMVPSRSTLTIASGVVTATGSYHLIDTESAGASDDLDTINGGRDGQQLIIRPADSAHTVVAKDGTGNLQLAGDHTMDNAQDTLTLLFDGALNAWIELSRSDNGA